MQDTRPVSTASVILAILAFWVALCFAFPTVLLARLSVDYSTQPTMVRIIETSAWVWPIVFGTVGVGLLASALAKRYVGIAHSVAAAGWGFLGSAMLTSSLNYEPPQSVLTGGLAVGAAFLHLAMIKVWTGLGVK